MNLTGKYTVEITDKNGNKKVFQMKNTPRNGPTKPTISTPQWSGKIN